MMFTIIILSVLLTSSLVARNIVRLNPGTEFKRTKKFLLGLLGFVLPVAGPVLAAVGVRVWQNRISRHGLAGQKAGADALAKLVDQSLRSGLTESAVAKKAAHYATYHSLTGTSLADALRRGGITDRNAISAALESYLEHVTPTLTAVNDFFKKRHERFIAKRDATSEGALRTLISGELTGLTLREGSERGIGELALKEKISYEGLKAALNGNLVNDRQALAVLYAYAEGMSSMDARTSRLTELDAARKELDKKEEDARKAAAQKEAEKKIEEKKEERKEERRKIVGKAKAKDAGKAAEPAPAEPEAAAATKKGKTGEGTVLRVKPDKDKVISTYNEATGKTTGVKVGEGRKAAPAATAKKTVSKTAKKAEKARKVAGIAKKMVGM